MGVAGGRYVGRCVRDSRSRLGSRVDPCRALYLHTLGYGGFVLDLTNAARGTDRTELPKLLVETSMGPKREVDLFFGGATRRTRRKPLRLDRQFGLQCRRGLSRQYECAGRSE